MKKILSAGLLFLGAAAILLAGCTQDLKDDIDDLKRQVDEINKTLSGLEETVDGLRSDVVAGKIITGVSNTTTDGYNVTIITYSDNSTTTIRHGKDGRDGTNGKDGVDGTNGQDGSDGNTPMVYIDGDGYWCIAPDGRPAGIADRLEDNSGNWIKAAGRDGVDGTNGKDGSDGKDGTNGTNGQDGTDGKDGKDGLDGQDGKHGHELTVYYDNDGMLCIEVYDPNLERNAENPVVVKTDIRRSDNHIHAIVEHKYYYEFLINDQVFRFGKEITVPQSIRVVVTSISSVIGEKAYTIFSVSPSNANFDVTNISLDYAGRTAATRSGFNFDQPEFVRIDKLHSLADIDQQAVFGLQDGYRYSSNGGEYVLEMTVVGELPFEQTGGPNAGIVPAYDIMIDYPALPSDFNDVLAATATQPEIEYSEAYTRSVNSLCFVKEIIPIVDDAFFVDPAEATIYYDGQFDVNIVRNAAEFPYDNSYLNFVDFDVIAAVHRSAAGTQISNNLSIYRGLVAVSNTAAAEDAPEEVLESLRVTTASEADWIAANVGYGEYVVFTFEATVADLQGSVRTQNFTLTVYRIDSRTYIHTDLIEPFYIPMNDGTVIMSAAGNEIGDALAGRLGFTAAKVADAVFGPDIEVRDHYTGNTVTGAPVSVRSTDNRLEVAIDRTIQPGVYQVNIPVTIDQRDVTLYYTFSVWAGDYTVKLTPYASSLLENIDGHVSVAEFAHALDHQVSIGDIIDAAGFSANKPVSTDVDVPAPADDVPAYVFVDGTSELAGNSRGITVSQLTVAANSQNWNKAQLVQIYVKFESGQVIPVQVIDQSNTAVEDAGQLYVAIKMNRITSFGTNPADGDTYPTVLSFVDTKTQPIDLRDIIGAVMFEGPALYVSGYPNILADSRIASITFAEGTIDLSQTTTEVQVASLIRIVDGELYTAGNILPWTGVIAQSVEIAIKDIWGTEFRHTVIFEFENQG